MVKIAKNKSFPKSAKKRLCSGSRTQETRPEARTLLQQEEVHTITVEASRSDSENETKGSDTELRERRARYAPLLQAALKGDWQDAEAFLKQNPNCNIALPITKEQGTALHHAAAAKRTTFVKQMVKKMSQSDLELKTTSGCTALMFAAQSGCVTIAQEMVEKNNGLPIIRMKDRTTPLGFAASLGPRHKNMVSYLFRKTPYQELTTIDRRDLLLSTISSDMYDITLKILENDPMLPLAEISETLIVWEALERLARKPLAIGSKSRLSIWERCLNTCFNRFYNKALMQTLAHKLVEKLWKLGSSISADEQLSKMAMANTHMNLLAEAAKVGNVEFLVILIRSYPDLIWQTDKKCPTLFHIAIKYRRENVFALIYEMGSLKDSMACFCDGNKNNMLHLAGDLAPPERLDIVPGAALQMQRELLWFKEIEKIVRPSFANMKNKDKLTPKDLFRQKHRDLREAGEKWMKDTANSCMLVAALIATVVFAATFTVPGGNNQETGTPIFLESKWFTVFFVSVAIALLSSSTSILIFLSVLTSRYTEDDFLTRLPRRLVFGLSTLFISIVSMVIAFSATCFLVYNSKSASVPTIIFAAAGIPISLFIVLQYDLWVDIIRSTYMSRFLFRNKHRLF